MAEPEAFTPMAENVVVSEELVPENVDVPQVEQSLDDSPGADTQEMPVADELQQAVETTTEVEEHADRQHGLPAGVERRGSRGGGGGQEREWSRDRADRTSRSANREQGGFRIRLSDNEMRAAKVIQDRFNLRSTVAVLGFSLRTLAQMIEQGEFSEQVEPSLPRSSRGGGPGRERPRGASGGARAKARPNPFARPPKPQAQSQPEEEQPATGNAVVGEDGEAVTTIES